ncbi:hypothetical protein [Microlunatus parietis]|uniref:Uncharacterized protein n=1 Tax=Microlunatus parietis TaxID=682979 RepID=A0A7Y9I622_9ACTN|nr:hypothetical protein [Microlunatus parietis]NYE70384.1 hypothetical protein [Microlunatus parietis]
MCGACGGERLGWLAGLLSSSYARGVVAARLNRFRPRSMITAHPSGWSWAWSGRARFFPTLDALTVALDHAESRPADLIDWVAGLPPHRVHLVPREASSSWTPGPPTGAVDPWPGGDPRTSVNRLLGLLLIGAGSPVTTELRDDQGTWTPEPAAVAAGIRSKINTGRPDSGSARVRGRTP